MFWGRGQNVPEHFKKVPEHFEMFLNILKVPEHILEMPCGKKFGGTF